MYSESLEVRISAPLVRVSTTRPIVGQFLDRTVEIVRVHWWNGRGMPCVVEDCPLCEEAVRVRPYGYISVLLVGRPAAVVLEVPASAATELLSWKVRLSSLQGFLFRAYRTSGKPNSSVEVHVGDHREVNRGRRLLCVRSCLATIWELPGPQFEEPLNHYTSRVRSALRARVAAGG